MGRIAKEANVIEGCEIPCPELSYCPGISSLTLLAIMLVFEAVAHQQRAVNRHTGSTNTQLTQ